MRKTFYIILSVILLIVNSSFAQDNEKDIPSSLSQEEMEQVLDTDFLIPAPSEIKAALNASGISSSALATWVDNKKFDFSQSTPKENNTVRLGMQIADVLLLVKPEDKGKSIVPLLMNIKEGFLAVGGGDKVNDLLASLISNIKKGSFSGKELIGKLDETRPAIMDEIRVQPDGNFLLLGLEAGGWLKATNVLAKAVIAQKDPSAGDLLIQPAVLDYFISNASGKLSSDVLASLNVLKQTIMKDGSPKKNLSQKDVQIIVDETNNLISKI